MKKLAFEILLGVLLGAFIAGLILTSPGCAVGKAAGVVPLNVEAPDTATGRDNANAGGWFTVQSVGGSVGLVIVSLASLAFMAWALTMLYNRFVCRYEPPCTKGHIPPSGPPPTR